MENDGWGSSSAKEYVFKNEALYLMSQEDEAAKKRIIYLLKEEGNNNNHVAMLIDLAIENDDEAFIKTLANQYSKGVSQEDLKKLMDYLLEKPQEENRGFIEKLLKKVEAEDLLFELAIKNGDNQFIREYASKHLSLSNTTLLNYLAGTKDKKNSETIIGLLVKEEKDIPSRPALGMIKSDHYGKLDSSYDNYISSVKDYNDACLTILNVAITTKNQYLAQRVVSKAKPNIVYKNLGDWEEVVVKKGYTSVYNAYKVTTDNSEQNSIKAAYQEAVRSGAFK